MAKKLFWGTQIGVKLEVGGCRIKVFWWVAPLASPMVSKRLQDDPKMPQMVPKVAEMDPNVTKQNPNGI